MPSTRISSRIFIHNLIQSIQSIQSAVMPTSRDQYSVSEASEALEEDSVWEDIPDANANSKAETGSGSGAATAPLSASLSARSTARRRELRMRRHHATPTAPAPALAPAPVSPAAPAPPAKHRRVQHILIDKDEWLEALSAAAVFTWRYTLDVLGHAIALLRRPLSVLVFLWLLALIVARVSHVLKRAFSPLCLVPGISRSPLCAAAAPLAAPERGRAPPPAPAWADYPTMVDVQSAAFGQLLDDSAGGSGLAREIKRAEMATTDLITLVRVSDTLKSRDLLAESLAQFVLDAKKTGRGLQRLSSKIGGAVDGILAVNDHALHTIEAAVANAPSRFSPKYLIPWYAPQPTSEIVTRTFAEAMGVLSAALARLTLEAEVSLAHLSDLEERLATLHAIVSREDLSIASARAELLADLWTMLGGNRRALRGFDEHLALLRNLGGYRRRAVAHVSAALHALQAMSEDMEDLRERVAAPGVAGARIPVEVHMRSIRSGLERLREGRVRARAREEEAVRRVLAG